MASLINQARAKTFYYREEVQAQCQKWAFDSPEMPEKFGSGLPSRSKAMDKSVRKVLDKEARARDESSEDEHAPWTGIQKFERRMSGEKLDDDMIVQKKARELNEDVVPV